MKSRIAARARDYARPLPLELRDLADQRRLERQLIYDFSAAELDGRLPDAVSRVVERALAGGSTGYSRTSGLPGLRAAVLGWLDAERYYSLENVVISSGASHSLLELFLVLCEVGDTVLVPPAPREDFVALAQVAGADTAVIAEDASRPDLKVTREGLLNALEARPVKLFVLSNPCSPTGQVYTAEEIRTFAEICADWNVFFLLDRRFWKIMFEPRRFPEPVFDEQTRAWVIQVDGLSNSFPRCSGLRVGWSIAPADVSEALINLQAHLHGSSSILSQLAAEALLENGFNDEWLHAVREKRDRWAAATAELPLVRILPTQATFYSFWDVSKLLQRERAVDEQITSAQELAEHLLERFGIVSTPGNCYGMPSYLRFSFSVPTEVLQKGAAALAEAVSSFS